LISEVNNTINVNLSRFDPEKDKKAVLVSYQIPFKKGMSVLNVLNYIYENLDSTLVYRHSCRIGLCTVCIMRINGRNRLACNTLVEGDIRVEPKSGSRVIKDLVTEIESDASGDSETRR